MEPRPTIKERGAHFTPTEIAEYIARRTYKLLEHTELLDVVSVLDPACGDGELLLAAYKTIKDSGKAVRVIGIESDRETLEIARERLEAILQSDDELELHCTDFLSCRVQVESVDIGQLDSDFNGQYLPRVDLIVANPPYVRTQVMGAEASQKLARRYKLTGKVDLYHAFFLAYADYLKTSSALGVITSNRYLYTKSGAVVRECLDAEYDIESIVDLGDTKVFTAAVLPALLFARLRRTDKHSVECARVYEVPGQTADHVINTVPDMLESPDGCYLYDGKSFKKESGHIRDTSNTKEPWVLASLEQEEWLDAVDSAAYCRVEDIAKVRVGVKTTADNVFIRDDWGTLENEPEQEWIKPLISSDDAAKWRVKSNTARKILYPYFSNSGKRRVADIDEYPKMKKYLEEHFEQLSGRQYVLKAKRAWYEIWVPQDPSAWEKPKAVFPDISSGARFLIDRSGAIIDGNCYWIQPLVDGDERLYLIAAVANSSLMDKYHSLAFQNVLYSGKRRYLTQYVSKYPIPDPEDKHSKEIVSHIKKALDNEEDIDDAYIDELVWKAFFGDKRIGEGR